MIAFTEITKSVKLYCLVALMTIGFTTQAQQDRYNWRFGLGVGNQYISGSPYAKDSTTSGKVVEFNNNYLAYSAFLELSLSQDFGLKVFTTTRPGDFTITNSGALLTYYFDNSYLFGSKAFIAPYFNLGAGFGEEPNSFNIPFGGGLKFRLNSRININLDYTARTYTNNWSDANFNFGNRLRGYSSVSLHYNFGKKSYSYKAPKPYVSSYPTIKYKAQIKEASVDSLQPKTLDTKALTKAVDSTLITKKSIIVDTINSIKSLYRDTTVSLPSPYGFAIVPQNTADKKDTLAVAKRTYQEERDSVLEELRYQIKKQRLVNELSVLRKNDTLKPIKRDSIVYKRDTTVIKQFVPVADTVKPKVSTNTPVQSYAPKTTGTFDSTAAQRIQNKPVPVSTQQQNSALVTPQTTTTEIRIVDERNKNNNNGETAALVAGAATAGALGVKVSNLQSQIDSLQRTMVRMDAASKAAANAPAKPSMVNDTVSDTTVTRQLIKPRAPLDTININEVELNLVKQRLRLLQERMDSLSKSKPQQSVPAPLVVAPAKPEKPKTAFETTGKVAVFFAVSSSALSIDAKMQLDDMIAFAKDRKDDSFLIKGFTDKTGSIEFNRTLSLKRAKAVEDYITSKGISTERLKTVNLGPDQSLGNGSQSFGRRVEVNLN